MGPSDSHTHKDNCADHPINGDISRPRGLTSPDGILIHAECEHDAHVYFNKIPEALNNYSDLESFQRSSFRDPMRQRLKSS